MGTRSTAAPEQYGFSQSDQRTDLYALAVTLRWMVTGSYRPEALETADCSQGMKRFLRKAASFAPADRYPDARSMGAALDRLAAPPRRRILPVLLACLAAILVAAGGWFLHQNRPVDFGSPLLEQAVRLELDRPGGADHPSGPGTGPPPGRSGAGDGGRGAAVPVQTVRLCGRHPPE